MTVLQINGHDYSRFVKASGYGWSREDLDSQNTTRLKNGKMRRKKIATKRKLSYTIIKADRATLAQLDDDLSQETFSATYMDLHGTQTKEFYCSSLAVTLDQIYDEDGMWSGGAFNMIEV